MLSLYDSLIRDISAASARARGSVQISPVCTGSTTRPTTAKTHPKPIHPMDAPIFCSKQKGPADLPVLSLGYRAGEGSRTLDVHLGKAKDPLVLLGIYARIHERPRPEMPLGAPFCGVGYIRSASGCTHVHQTLP